MTTNPDPALTLHYDASGPDTVLSVHGLLDAHGCDLLREALEVARALRPHGRIVIDLGDVDTLGPTAQACLGAAVEEGRCVNRPTLLRNAALAAPVLLRAFASTPTTPSGAGR